MADITLYGSPQSTYVRTARIAAEEKGISHDLQPIELADPNYRKLHPFGRMPAMKHGDTVLYETAAITRYIDEVFPGPKLQPTDAKARAEMTKWISASNAYLDGFFVRQVLIEKFVKPRIFKQPTDEAVVAKAMPFVTQHFAALDSELGKRPYLAGSEYSLADMFVAPIVFYAQILPEGHQVLKGKDNIGSWFGKVSARKSFAATAPQMG
jgi:glutathione S-transferase